MNNPVVWFVTRCAYCHLPRRKLDIYGTCRRCRGVIAIFTGHPDRPAPIEGSGRPFPSLALFDRRPTRPWAGAELPGAGTLS